MCDNDFIRYTQAHAAFVSLTNFDQIVKIRGKV